MLELKHGNAILHMELSTDEWSVEEKVSDHGENKNSRLDTGEDIRRGRLKRKQLEIPGYADTKTVFIRTL